MSFTTIPQSTLPENRPTRLVTHPSGYIQPRRPSPYPVLPRHLPSEIGLRDSWVVEHDRPRDFYNRGPYGTPGWRPDPRTGRHRQHERPDRRRDERPDPIPAPATEAEYAARLQEIAWDRFLRKTADFAAAHVGHRKPSIAARLANAVKRAFATITRTSRILPTATA